MAQTFDEWWDIHGIGGRTIKHVAHGAWCDGGKAAYAAGVKAERERCARQCEDRAMSHNGPHVVTLEMNQIARQIRAFND